MYAIVNIAGQQFKVEKGKKIFVHQLPGDIGTTVSFDKVLLVSNNDKVRVGEPYVNNAVVSAQILSHLRGDKIKVFKKKKRKGYQVLKGHRQHFTELMIEDISETGLAKKAAKKTKPEDMQDVSKPEMTADKQKEKKIAASARVKEKQAEKTVKPEEREAQKTTDKDKTEKPKTVKKVAKSAPAAKATRPKTAKKVTAESKPVKKTAETKGKPAAKKAAAKKQGTAQRKPDTKQK